jgi:hypothetical protein
MLTSCVFGWGVVAHPQQLKHKQGVIGSGEVLPQPREPRDKVDSRDLASWMCALSDAYLDGSALGFSCHTLLVQDEAVRKGYQSCIGRRIFLLGEN